MYDDESDEGESSSNGYTGYSENLCFVISKLWIERKKHINTDYAMTGWMLCVIHQIWEDVFKNSNENNRNQVNTVLENLFLIHLKMSCMKPLIHFGVNIY